MKNCFQATIQIHYDIDFFVSFDSFPVTKIFLSEKDKEDAWKQQQLKENDVETITEFDYEYNLKNQATPYRNLKDVVSKTNLNTKLTREIVKLQKRSPCFLNFTKVKEHIGLFLC